MEMEEVTKGVYKNSEGKLVNKYNEPIETWGGKDGFHTSARQDQNIRYIILAVCIASPILLILMFMAS